MTMDGDRIAVLSLARNHINTFMEFPYQSIPAPSLASNRKRKT